MVNLRRAGTPGTIHECELAELSRATANSQGAGIAVETAVNSDKTLFESAKKGCYYETY